MNIGDRVRMIHDRQEGVITRLIDRNMVEVEIEDGFRIPVVKKELVVVEPNPDPVKVPDPLPVYGAGKKQFAENGIFAAFIPQNDTLLSLYLVNNTDYGLPFTSGELVNGVYSGSNAGVLQPKSYFEVATADIRQFEKWPHWVFQFLFAARGHQELKEPVQLRFKPKAAQFFSSKTRVPVLNMEGHCFQLDASEKRAIDALKLKEAITGQATKVGSMVEAEAVVDLHFEKISPGSKGLSNAEMLAIQVSRFEQALDRAIATGLSEITFIHGVGAGVLKTEIHTRLSRDKRIKFYQDAQKEKFGYGATLVSLV